MRAVLVGVFAVVVIGCDFGVTTCETDDVCGDGRCVDGFCVAPDAGSGGGGGTGGGLGGGVGGGLGGGTGGGTDGGTDGGSDGGMGGGGGSCVLAACAFGQECGSAGCIDAPLDISVTQSPQTVGYRFEPFRGEVVRADGGSAAGVKLPDALSVSVVGGGLEFSGDAGLSAAAFVFGVRASPGANGPRMVILSLALDAGEVSKSTAIELDTTPPIVTLTVQPGSSADGGWQRDEAAVVTLTAPEPLAGVTLSLAGVALTDGGRCSAPPDQACLEWRAPLWQPPLDGIEGSLAVTAAGTDMREVPFASQDAGVGVTRIRWVRQVTASGEKLRVAPAVGADGRVYVGTTDGQFPGGRLVAVEPGDAGTFDGGSTVGGVLALAVSPPDAGLINMLEGSTVYAVANIPGAFGGRLRGYTPGLDPQGLPSECEANGTNRAWSGLALTRTTGNRVAAVATTASSFGNPGRLLRWSPANGCTGQDLPQSTSSLGSPLEPSVVGGTLSMAVSPIVVGNSAWFVTTQPSSNGLPDAGLFLRGVLAINTGTPSLAASAIALDGSAFTRSVGLVPVATNVLVTSKDVTGSTFLASSTDVSPAPVAAGDHGLPALASGTLGYIGVGSALYSFNPATPGTSISLFESSSGATAPFSPVLLAGKAGGSGLGHTVFTDGTLVSFAVPSGTTDAVWIAKLPVAQGDQVSSHPGFDCNRKRSAAGYRETGLLYVPFLDGNLVAVIVDSPKLLDGPNAWPKYQRTMGNAGNDDTAFFKTNWESCDNP